MAANIERIAQLRARRDALERQIYVVGQQIKRLQDTLTSLQAQLDTVNQELKTLLSGVQAQPELPPPPELLKRGRGILV